MKKGRHSHYLAYKKHARVLVVQKVAHWGAHYAGYGYEFASGFGGIAFANSVLRISIRNQRTRWGSCSQKGNLNFNYKIALLPEKLADYIIVHELCHLGQFNHSQDFWDLVAVAIPDHQDRRRELRSIEREIMEGYKR